MSSQTISQRELLEGPGGIYERFLGASNAKSSLLKEAATDAFLSMASPLASLTRIAALRSLLRTFGSQFVSRRVEAASQAKFSQFMKGLSTRPSPREVGAVSLRDFVTRTARTGKQLLDLPEELFRPIHSITEVPLLEEKIRGRRGAWNRNTSTMELSLKNLDPDTFTHELTHSILTKPKTRTERAIGDALDDVEFWGVTSRKEINNIARTDPTDNVFYHTLSPHESAARFLSKLWKTTPPPSSDAARELAFHTAEDTLSTFGTWFRTNKDKLKPTYLTEGFDKPNWWRGRGL